MNVNSASSRIYLFGERGSGTPFRNRTQDFYKLREKCLKSGRLFEDPDFTMNSSLMVDNKKKKVDWKRPGELAKDPKLFIDGASRFDVLQGSLGNCWFISAMAELPPRPKLLKHVMPDDQSFTKDYAGIFHFRFWQYGKWIDIVIDDRLPTVKGRLIYACSNDKNEFWSALLEKAYAKMYGGYDKLNGGKANEAMEDLTGGLGEHYILKVSPPKNLFKIMLNASRRNSMMASQVEDTTATVKAGFIPNHAYSINKIIHINVSNQKEKVGLLRLRNPWGAGQEWNGAWSDQSPEWKSIPAKTKEDLGLNFSRDGEFWMSWEDFFRLTSVVSLCHLNPGTMIGDDSAPGSKKWDVYVFDGKWVKGVTAGGRKGEPTFHLNPQYRIKVQADPDDADEGGDCSVVVGLMQKMKRNSNVPSHIIGFEMFLIENPEAAPKPLDDNYFRKYRSNRLGKPMYTTEREIWSRVNLPTGVYCIIPTTVEPHQEGEFHLRVFSERKSNVELNDVELTMGALDPRLVESDRLTPHERHAKDTKNFELFMKVAGEDKEVSWRELQALLNTAMKEELQKSKEGQETSIVSSVTTSIWGMFRKDPISNMKLASKSDGFSKEVCRSMIAMMDPDHSGKLNYNEFKSLWTDLLKWKSVFKLYDKDNSGELSAFELRNALNSAGYKVNHQVLNTLVQRYGTKDNAVAFDDFIMCAVKLKAMINFFKEKDPENTNKAMFTLEEWTEKTLYS